METLTAQAARDGSVCSVENSLFWNGTCTRKARGSGDVSRCVREVEHSQQYYWIDVAMKNQHEAVSDNKAYREDTKREFWRSIRGPGRVILIANSIVNSMDIPSPFTRIWCLYEIFTSLATGSELVIAPKALKLEDLKDWSSNLTQIRWTIGLKKAEATEKFDADSIFGDIERLCSIKFVNENVRDAIARVAKRLNRFREMDVQNGFTVIIFVILWFLCCFPSAAVVSFSLAQHANLVGDQPQVPWMPLCGIMIAGGCCGPILQL